MQQYGFSRTKCVLPSARTVTIGALVAKSAAVKILVAVAARLVQNAIESRKCLMLRAWKCICVGLCVLLGLMTRFASLSFVYAG